MAGPVPPRELGTGLCQYGDFIFPNFITAKIQTTPEQDSTERFTKYTRHNITIETVLFPGCHEDLYISSGQALFQKEADSAELGMLQVRRILTTRGLPLAFRDKGFGGIEINTDASAEDRQDEVLEGPTPKVLSWEPLGDNYAVRIVWQCEVVLAECSKAAGNLANKLTEFNYSHQWAIDINGITTRTVTGSWEVVLQIQNGVVLNTADFVRDRLGITIPRGFVRQSQTFTLNNRRDRIDFVIVDRETPNDDKNPYSEGLTLQDVKQTTETSSVLAGTSWLTTITGNYEVAKGFPRYLAWKAFINVVTLRMKRAYDFGNKHQSAISSPGEEDDTTEPNRDYKHIIPGKLSITEDIYGRSMSFSFNFVMISTLKKFLEASGIWQPIPVETPHTARMQIAGGPWSVRGYRRLKELNPTVALIGLCLNQSQGVVQEPSQGNLTEDEYSVFKTPCPPRESSYVCFEAHVEVIDDTSQYYLYENSGGERKEPENPFDPAGSNPNWPKSGSASEIAQKPTVHTRGGNRMRVLFYGKAARLGYSIPQIYLKSYGGADVRPVGKHNWHTLPPKDMGGCFLYRATWSREYIVFGQPTGDAVATRPRVEATNQSCPFGG